jgi:pilus assembly protein Flp/PilA
MDLVTYWQRHCGPYLRARLDGGDEGASLIEYALLVALIAMVCILAITFLGNKTSAKYSGVASGLSG